MKQSFTYSGEAKTRRDAIKRAKKEGMKFSDLVEKLLQAYNASEQWKTFETPPRHVTKIIHFDTQLTKEG